MSVQSTSLRIAFLAGFLHAVTFLDVVTCKIYKNPVNDTNSTETFSFKPGNSVVTGILFGQFEPLDNLSSNETVSNVRKLQNVFSVKGWPTSAGDLGGTSNSTNEKQYSNDRREYSSNDESHRKGNTELLTPVDGFNGTSKSSNGRLRSPRTTSGWAISANDLKRSSNQANDGNRDSNDRKEYFPNDEAQGKSKTENEWLTPVDGLNRSSIPSDGRLRNSRVTRGWPITGDNLAGSSNIKNPKSNKREYSYKSVGEPQSKVRTDYEWLNDADGYITSNSSNGRLRRPRSSSGDETPGLGPMKVVYQRKQLDFTWNSAKERAQALENGSFIPVNNIFSGMKIWKNKIFVTLPRWRPGMPVSLAYLDEKNLTDLQDLQPFPNWEMQKLGDCNAIQFIANVEIDPKGRMWVIDSGGQRLIDEKYASIPQENKCDAKIIVMDLNSYNFDQSSPNKSKNITILQKYTLPPDISNNAYLADVVLDLPKNLIYIADLSLDPGLIVYNFVDKKSWKVRDKSLQPEPNFPLVNFNGEILDIHTKGADALALSPIDDIRTVYYSPYAGRTLYSVPTVVLQPNANISKYVKKVAHTDSVMNSYIIDNQGNLYMPMPEKNSIVVWNIKDKLYSPKIFAQDDQILRWADGLSIDEDSNLWLTSNDLIQYIADKVDPEKINYRILKGNIGNRSYLYPKN